MMTRRWGFLFPGQASQSVGMGQALFACDEIVQDTFARAETVLGYSLSTLCFQGPEKELNLTEKTQPAVLTVSVAAWRLLSKRLPMLRPLACAGHSLGEFSALVCAGALTLEEAVGLVQARGRFMQEAVPAGVGAMAAVVGLPLSTVEAICQDAAQGQVCACANLNTAEQTVISGHKEAVERALALVKEQHKKRGMLLPVSAPFHCALMQDAADRLAERLQSVAFLGAGQTPVISNVDAKPHREGQIAQ